MNKSVYQSQEYKKSIKIDNKILDISEDYYALEKEISSVLGKKLILEGWGTPTKEDLKSFKEISKKYFYGTIHATVLDKNNSDFLNLGFKKVKNSTILIDLRKTE